MRRLLACLIATSLCLSPFAYSLAGAAESDGPELTIGDQAPAIDIEHWLSTGGGKFEPVTNFEDGQVYVVEFWATWCGPCVMSMPHLAETQKEYADRGVTIISVSDEDLETVEPFLEREVMQMPQRPQATEEESAEGESSDAEEQPGVPSPKTYADLTSAYCLTTDPDKSVYDDYFKAAGQSGIPCAFIVGKTGVVEWIGHPMAMDEPLEQVVTDSWDREAFAEEFRIEQMVQTNTMKAVMAARSGKFDEFESIVKELEEMKMPESSRARVDRLIPQLRDMVLMGKLMKEPEAGVAELEARADSLEPGQIVRMAASLTRTAARGTEVPAASLAAVAKQLQTIMDEDNPQGVMLHTMAQLEYYQGNTEKALELESQALETDVSADVRSVIEAFVERIKSDESAEDSADGP